MIGIRRWTTVTNMKVAVLHPGAMGITVAQALVANDHEVVWVRAGRSDATAELWRELGPALLLLILPVAALA